MVKVFLPLKANSQRVNRKNLSIINGKPLYFWTLVKLQAAAFVDEIIVNSDDISIFKDNWGRLGMNDSKIVWEQRRNDVMDPQTPMNDVIQSSLINFDETDIIIQTHVTSPFLSVDTLRTAVELFDGENTVFSVQKIQKRLYNKDGTPSNHNLEVMQNTQDIEPIFEETSAFFIFSKVIFNRRKNRMSLNPTFYECTPLENIDIDTPEDFLLAELIMKGLEK